MSHHYLSTACLHNLHDKCRLTCKYCGNRCICSICNHVVSSEESKPITGVESELWERLPNE